MFFKLIQISLERYLRAVTLLTCLITFIYSTQSSPIIQTTDSSEMYSDDVGVFYPIRKPYDFGWSLGISITNVPKDIVEEEINRFPFLDVHCVFPLPLHFALTGHLNTMILTNRVSMGLRWGYQIDKLALTLGNDFAFLYGFVTLEGFDNSINSWLFYPNINLGYDFGDFQFIAKAEMEYLTSQSTYAGDIAVTDSRNRRNGYAFSGIIEQPFYGKQKLAIGLKISYSDFVYQAWPAFETFKRILITPEVFCAFTFP